VNEQKSVEEMAALIRVLQRDLDAARKEIARYKGGGVVPAAGEDGVVFDSVAYAELRVEYDELKNRSPRRALLHSSKKVPSLMDRGAGC
jgi:hypothetical protein